MPATFAHPRPAGSGDDGERSTGQRRRAAGGSFTSRHQLTRPWTSLISESRHFLEEGASQGRATRMPVSSLVSWNKASPMFTDGTGGSERLNNAV